MSKKNEIAVVQDGAVFVLQAGTPIYVKTADICSIIGKSNQWVGQLTAQGTLNKAKTPHGSLYDLSASLKSYIGSIASKVEERAETDEKLDKARLMAELKLKKAKADMAQYQADEFIGKFHRSEDVEAMTDDLVFAVRGALMALPNRLALKVSDVSDAVEISEIIKQEVYSILEELSLYKYDPRKYEERVRERLKMNSLKKDEEE